MTNVAMPGFVEPTLIPTRPVVRGRHHSFVSTVQRRPDPIKFYHYLAHGKPVVTTPSPSRASTRPCQMPRPTPLPGRIERALSGDDDAVAGRHRGGATPHVGSLVPGPSTPSKPPDPLAEGH